MIGNAKEILYKRCFVDNFRSIHTKSGRMQRLFFLVKTQLYNIHINLKILGTKTELKYMFITILKRCTEGNN